MVHAEKARIIQLSVLLFTIYYFLKDIHYFNGRASQPTDRLVSNISSLGLNLTEDETYRLNNIAIFIEDIKKTASLEDALNIQHLNI